MQNQSKYSVRNRDCSKALVLLILTDNFFLNSTKNTGFFLPNIDFVVPVAAYK